MQVVEVEVVTLVGPWLLVLVDLVSVVLAVALVLDHPVLQIPVQVVVAQQPEDHTAILTADLVL
jgi:hypothetical protein